VVGGVLDRARAICYCLPRLRLWTLTSIVVSVLLFSGAPQEAPGTLGGVFTEAQAARGEETYMAVCVSCHPAGTYKTEAFRTAWKGRPLSDLFDQVKEKMPKNDPASLTPGEYAQVVAYMLKINGVPAGEIELPSESDALKKIRIEMPRHD
jgi:cytochrome c553